MLDFKKKKNKVLCCAKVWPCLPHSKQKVINPLFGSRGAGTGSANKTFCCCVIQRVTLKVWVLIRVINAGYLSWAWEALF